MATHSVEVFSAGCGLCTDAVAKVQAIACSNCGVEVRDMNDPAVAADARRYGVTSVPAVVIDGVLAGCCQRGGIDLDELRRMGLGQA